MPVTNASRNARAWRGWVNTMVRKTPVWAIGSSRQYPARWSAGLSGSGRRASQRWRNTLIVAGCSAPQFRCSVAGSPG